MEPRTNQLSPKAVEEARESRESPRMEQASSRRRWAAFFRGAIPHLPYLVIKWKMGINHRLHRYDGCSMLQHYLCKFAFTCGVKIPVFTRHCLSVFIREIRGSNSVFRFIRVPSRDSRAKSGSGFVRSFTPRPACRSERGAALVIVLGFLVLITILAVAFFSSVTTEYSSASSAAAGSTARELADASVQLVMGQIRQATSLGTSVAWASQPGMIRTYGIGSPPNCDASSSPLYYYKLYSSDNMVVDMSADANFDPASDVSATWYSNPAVFTDLNAPITNSSNSTSGNSTYPIMDPAAADTVSGYPMVEGFSITNPPKDPTATGSTQNPAPMPVKWIYVLRNGELTAPTADSTGNTADFASSAKPPTADNPIVGRIAFWTDDETCKLNLNTACGGTFWDTPRFTTSMELNFSRYKPAAKEYPRFPGHPATTSLVPVFWSLTGMSTPNDNLFPVITPPISGSFYDGGTAIGAALSSNVTSTWQNLLQFAPRNAWGGSEMGSIPTNGDGVTYTTSGADVGGFASVVPDSDRLYASVDEAIFGYPLRDAQTGNKNALLMMNDQLKKLPFFLTTTSRSPETNPFNQPKVGIWPVPQLTDNRSAADSLIAFCSTLKPDASQTPSASNNFTYFFTRNNAQSATADWTTRNRQIFDYLDGLLQNPIPGFGASFDSRYSVSGNRRLLTLIYDYIRSTINLIDSALKKGDTAPNYTVNLIGGDSARPYNVYKNTFAPSDPQYLGFGQAVPIKITKDGVAYKGAGRFPVISQAGIVFVARAANQPPLLCYNNGRPVVYRLTSNSTYQVITEGNGTISSTNPLYPQAVEAVFSGNAYAKLNPLHPWVAGSVTTATLGTTYVPQFRNGAGNPVMAIDSALVATGVDATGGNYSATNPNPAAFLPVFGMGVSATLQIPPTDVARITNGAAYTQYPTLYAEPARGGQWGIMAGITGNITITIPGPPATSTTYTYATATFPGTPANQTNPPQTHAGMPYLTVQSATTYTVTTTSGGVTSNSTVLAGAFAVPNPRYQGKGARYNDGDQWGNLNSRELPDPTAAITSNATTSGLPVGATQMQAVILIDPVDLTCGSVPLTPSYLVKITGIGPNAATSTSPATVGFQADGTLLFPPPPNLNPWTNLPRDPAIQSVSWQRMPNPYYYLGWNTISAGDGSYNSDVQTLSDGTPNPYYGASWGAVRRSSGTGSSQQSFLSVPVVVSGPTFAFTGGEIQVDIYAGPTAATQSNIPIPAVADLGTPIQTYHITFPSASGAHAFPTPMLPPMPAGFQGCQFNNELIISKPNTPESNFSSYGSLNFPGSSPTYPPMVADIVPSSMLTADPASPLARVTSGAGGPNYGVGPLTITGAQFYSSPPLNNESSAYMDGAISLSGWGGSGYTPVRFRFYYETGNSNDGCRTAYFLPERNGDPSTDDAVKRNCDTIRSVECVYGDPRVYVSLPDVGTQFFAPHRWYFDNDKRAAHTFRSAPPTQPPGSEASAYSLFRGATEHFLSDAYLTIANWNYNALDGSAFSRRTGSRLTTINWLAGANSSLGVQTGLTSGAPCVTSSAEFDPAVISASSLSWSGLTPLPDVWATGGDFSNGIGSEPDGPYLNKPNETGGSRIVGQNNNNLYPEWWAPGTLAAGTGVTMPAQFSPNRMIASPVAFGSLPAPSSLNTSGVPSPSDAWHTLLFCPNPNASTTAAYAPRMSGTDVTLPGAVPTGPKCPDHLLLDFFVMPVVEPYAISEPFSTAGKVNMNYQIAPFSYITRNTALRGVFSGTMVTAVDDKYVASLGAGTYWGGATSSYKSVGGTWGYGGPSFARATGTDAYRDFLVASGQWGFRYPIHPGETLKQFQARFDKGDLFRSPSEICSLFLYPAKQPLAQSDPATALVSWDALNANILNWWYADPAGIRKSLTGDNLRERPYDTLYPRLTTKSNSYTVHFRVQVLKKIPGTSVTEWVEGKDVVASEFRGSSLVERYIDPGDPTLPDFANNLTYDTLDNHYKFRVVSTKKFTAQ